MPTPRLILALLLAATPAALPAALRAQEKTKVVVTFSILADFVREVGGERVELTTLVGPDGDAHVYSPTPADARRLSDARLVVMNGLGFEGWIGRLTKSSGSKAALLEASKGVQTVRAGAKADHGHRH